MFQQVVWATDGSAGAEDALPLATALARDGSGRMVIAHCIEYAPGAKGAPITVHVDEDDVRLRLEKQAEQLNGEGLHVETRFAVVVAGGGPAHVVADIARDVQADVIVVATRGHTALGGLLVGSVTQRLLQVAPCPVLVVPASASQ